MLKQPRNNSLGRVRQESSLEALSPFRTSLKDMKTVQHSQPLTYGAGAYSDHILKNIIEHLPFLLTQLYLYFKFAFSIVMDVKRPQILCSSSPRDEIYFPILWIWTGPVTCFDQQNVEVPCDFWASQLLLLHSWKASTIRWRRPRWKTCGDGERAPGVPSVWDTRLVSEATLDGPAPGNPQARKASPPF